jgi:hypothetical protein
MRHLPALVLSGAFLHAAPALAQRVTKRPSTPPPVQVQVVGVEATAGGPVVLLKTVEGERFVPIWVGEAEAFAIQLRLLKQAPPRPLTHDLLDNVIHTLGAHVTRVVVADLRDGVFIGRIDLRAGRTDHHLDARSSDSIALALGTGVPIFVATHVLDEAGFTLDELRSGAWQGTPIPVERRHSL